MHRSARDFPGLSISAENAADITRALPEETAVALVYNGTTQAVMMATPHNLRAFAVGFSLSEEIVTRSEEIESLEVVKRDNGIELRMWLSSHRAEVLHHRRRVMAGPVGCGLCGLDSLKQALRPVTPVTSEGPILTACEVDQAMHALASRQPLHDRTHAVHAAGFYRSGDGMLEVYEDVGRHNALDKLIGALALKDRDASGGAIVLTSRISIDMVQKCAIAKAAVVIAVSAPTAQAVKMAEDAGMTLAARARGQGFEIFSHAHRIKNRDHSNVS